MSDGNHIIRILAFRIAQTFFAALLSFEPVLVGLNPRIDWIDPVERGILDIDTVVVSRIEELIACDSRDTWHET